MAQDPLVQPSFGELTSFLLRRRLRNARDWVAYPFWLASGRTAPDNHIEKRKRIVRMAQIARCNAFVETGTFYGQTTNAVQHLFAAVFTCELSPRLFALNRESFKRKPNVRVIHGDSSSALVDILRQVNGERILFWLDGHYSGPGTAQGRVISPLMEELTIIGRDTRNDHCILIDDLRLCTGSGGYPHLNDIQAKLRHINTRYEIYADGDCLVARAT